MSVLQDIALIQLPPDFDPDYEQRLYREQGRKRLGIIEIDGLSIYAQMFGIPLDILYPAQPLHNETPSTP